MKGLAFLHAGMGYYERAASSVQRFKGRQYDGKRDARPTNDGGPAGPRSPSAATREEGAVTPSFCETNPKPG